MKSDNLDNQKSENNINDDVDQQAEDQKQATIIRLFLSIICLLIALFCYFILDFTKAPFLLLLVIGMFNYQEEKKAHEARLKARKERQQKRLAEKNNRTQV